MPTFKVLFLAYLLVQKHIFRLLDNQHIRAKVRLIRQKWYVTLHYRRRFTPSSLSVRFNEKIEHHARQLGCKWRYLLQDSFFRARVMMVLLAILSAVVGENIRRKVNDSQGGNQRQNPCYSNYVYRFLYRNYSLRHFLTNLSNAMFNNLGQLTYHFNVFLQSFPRCPRI